jgi:hypothetical protein
MQNVAKQQQKPWIVGSRREVAEFLKVPSGTVATWLGDGMPGVAREYDLQAIAIWVLSKGRKIGWAIGDTQQVAVLDDDPMLQESDSEGLERYRMARAQQEEIKLAEKRGEVVLMDRFNDCVRVALAPLRKVQETFKRRGDRESIQLIHEAIDEMERGLAQLDGE